MNEQHKYILKCASKQGEMRYWVLHWQLTENNKSTLDSYARFTAIKWKLNLWGIITTTINFIVITEKLLHILGKA